MGSSACCQTTLLAGPSRYPPVQAGGVDVDSVDLDGLKVAYTRGGDGPPLVLLHGYVGDGHATWHRQLEEFSDEFTVVAWDAPGAGRSADPPEDFGIAGYADCLAKFIDRLHLRNPHIAGLSFGGALAIEFARRHPSVPASLVLASAYAGWGGSLPADAARQRLQQALELSELSPDKFVDTLLPTMFPASTPPEMVDAFGVAMRQFHPAGFRAMARAAAEDIREALPLISVPTLLVYGDKDVRAPLAVANALNSGISDSTLVVLSGAGHVCNIDAADEFETAVRAFLHERVPKNT